MASPCPCIITPYTQSERGKVIDRGVHIIFTPHAQRERGKVIDRGVHVCGQKKKLNRTLEIDSPFQTLTVGLLVEFID